MPDQDQAIKIVVEIVDKFSKPLRDLQNQLQQLGKGEGSSNLGKITVGFEDLRESVTKTAGTVKGLLAPAMGVLGISVVGLGAAFAGLTSGLKEFAAATKSMIFLSRETGITIEKLNELQAVGKAAGVGPQQFASSMNVFARNMQQLRTGVGTSLGTLLREGDAGVRRFALSMRSVGDNAQAFEKVLGFIQTLPREIDKQRVLEAFGLPAEFARLTRQEIDQVIADHQKYAGTLTEQGKKSINEFNRALRNLGFTWEGIWTQMANEGTLNTFKEAINSWAEVLRSKPFQDALHNFAMELAELAKHAPALISLATAMLQWMNAPSQKPTGKESPLQWSPLQWWKAGRWGIDLGSGQIGPKGMLPGGVQAPAGVGKPFQYFGMFGGGTSKEDATEITAEGTKKGFLDGMREYFGFSANAATGGGVGGWPGRGTSTRGVGGTGGGIGGGGGAGIEPTSTEGLGGSEYTKALRSGFAKEIEGNPALKEYLAAISHAENQDPRARIAVIESLFNRMAYINEDRKKRGLPPISVEQALHGYLTRGKSFYGPIRTGAVNQHLAYLRAHPAEMEQYKAAVSSAYSSNLIQGFTNQGSARDPAYVTGGVGVNIARERFNLYEAGPGGFAGAEAWRLRYLAAVRAESNRAKIDAVSAQSTTRPNGNANLRIDLYGFPKGTATTFEDRWAGMDTQINRYNPAPAVNQ